MWRLIYDTLMKNCFKDWSQSTGLTDIGSGTSSSVALGCLLWNILAVYQNLVSLPSEVLMALAQP